MTGTRRAPAIILLLLLAAPTHADEVISDDLIVDGSACVGFDCAAGESFGSDALRIKEDNLRIHFNDTSSGSSFPDNDWRIRINDSTNGGASYFAIEDSSAGRDILELEAGAPANSIYVTGSRGTGNNQDPGRVGLNTNSPSTDLHLVDGDTAEFRLEQDGSKGFTAQTWDVAGNETNFFIRDVTHNSKLPFRIKPGADDDSLFIAANENIGLGTDSPDAALDIERSGGATAIRVTDKSTTDAKFDLIAGDIKGDGKAGFRIQKVNDPNATIDLAHDGSVYFGDDGGFIWNARTRDLDVGGDMLLAGSFQGMSSRATKTAIEAIDAATVLQKLLDIEVAEWSYIKDGDGVRHIGPMAEDFYTAFGLGRDASHIGVLDAAGVALAAIQGLHTELEKKEARIAALEAANDELRQALKRREVSVEARLGALEDSVRACNDGAQNAKLEY